MHKTAAPVSLTRPTTTKPRVGFNEPTTKGRSAAPAQRAEGDYPPPPPRRIARGRCPRRACLGQTLTGINTRKKVRLTRFLIITRHEPSFEQQGQKCLQTILPAVRKTPKYFLARGETDPISSFRLPRKQSFCFFFRLRRKNKSTPKIRCARNTPKKLVPPAEGTLDEILTAKVR